MSYTRKEAEQLKTLQSSELWNQLSLDKISSQKAVQLICAENNTSLTGTELVLIHNERYPILYFLLEKYISLQTPINKNEASDEDKKQSESIDKIFSKLSSADWFNSFFWETGVRRIFAPLDWMLDIIKINHPVILPKLTQEFIIKFSHIKYDDLLKILQTPSIINNFSDEFFFKLIGCFPLTKLNNPFILKRFTYKMAIDIFTQPIPITAIKLSIFLGSKEFLEHLDHGEIASLIAFLDPYAFKNWFLSDPIFSFVLNTIVAKYGEEGRSKFLLSLAAANPKFALAMENKITPCDQKAIGNSQTMVLRELSANPSKHNEANLTSSSSNETIKLPEKVSSTISEKTETIVSRSRMSP